MPKDSNPPVNTSVDSQSLLNQIVMDYIQDKKRERYWTWVKRAFYALIICALLVFYWLTMGNEEIASVNKPHVGLVELNGEIFDTKPANADDFAKGVDMAYKSKGLRALMIRINSPGGSPVQAEYMYNTLKYYRQKFPKIKIYAVCVDLCASAAYYVAVAAGSIGVIFNGFGFVDAMQKLGVSRRMLVSGVNKGFMDPFTPIDESQQKKLQTMLDLIHKQFIDRVKAGRGNKLLIDSDTFSGLLWTGEQALANGLVDGYGSSGQVARDIVKIRTVIDYTRKQTLLDRVSKNFGAAMAEAVPSSLGMQTGVH
jgi:protease-4